MARPPEAAAFLRDVEIISSVRSIDQLFRSGILQADNRDVMMAGVTQVLILLNDLMQKADDEGLRITFNDDIDPAWGDDITAFVRTMRNAVCHIPSGLRDFQGSRLSFNVIRGLMPQAFVFNDVAIGCDYADDIAVNYGGMRIYVHRHLVRAAQAVSDALMPLVEQRRLDRIRADIPAEE